MIINSRDDAAKFLSVASALRDERRKRVDRAQDFDELFEIVKRIIDEELGKHRAGLSLVLANMPNELGAYHPVGTNMIVVNKALINGLQRVTKNPKEVNAFIFMVLMHEYLHSLGYLDENEVRKLSQAICRNSLGSDHPTVNLANANWIEKYPQLGTLSQSGSKEFEVVRKFDSSSTAYIG